MGRGPEDEDEGLEGNVVRIAVWQVIAYQHMYSHDGKPSEHSDYKP
jgi:hypothetical protein